MVLVPYPYLREYLVLYIIISPRLYIRLDLSRVYNYLRFTYLNLELLQLTLSNDFVGASASDLGPTVNLNVNAEQEATENIGVVYEGSYDQGLSEKADISAFLQRPVLVSRTNWSPGASIDTNIPVWDLLFSNTAIINKLNNYHLMRAGIEVEVLINGLPDHQGRLLLSYQYGSRDNASQDTANYKLFNYTTRPHIEMDVASSQGGKMTLPFFWPHNWIDLQTDDFESGILHLTSYGTLKQLDAGVNDVTISIFARFVDIVLTAPTAGDFVGASAKVDEYQDKGPVEAAANAVVAMSNSLSNVPIIKPYALATSIGASAVGNIAKMFGWSKPANISTISNMRPDPIGQFASVDGHDTVAKLSMTAKQELTIDPKTTGIPENEDPLSFKYLFPKPSFFNLGNWSISDSVGDIIFFCPVTPALRAIDGNGHVVSTLAAYLGRPFEFWSGSINFHFNFIVNKFTRGKLAIVYEPTGNDAGITVDGTNTNFMEIIDLCCLTECKFTVPYMQARPYLRVSGTDGWSNASGPFGFNRESINGVIYIKVMNELNQRDNVTDVDFTCKISLGDDFEFANPQNNGESFQDMQYIGASMASNEEGNPTGSEACEDRVERTLGTVQTESSKPLEFFGEKIVSLRPLLKRYNAWRFQKLSSTTDYRHTLYSQNFPQFPYYFGNFPTAADTLNGTPGNNVANTFLHYTSQMFAAWRGGIRYKVVPTIMENSLMSFTHRQVQRVLVPAGTHAIYPLADITTPDDALSLVGDIFAHTHTGTHVVNATNNALSFELPYATNKRFSNTKRDFGSNSEGENYPCGYVFQTNIDTQYPTPRGDHMFVLYNVAAAEDFQLFGFLGPPAYTIGSRTP